MHDVVARLLTVAAAGSALVGCKTICNAPRIENRRSFDQLGQTAPLVVAEVYENEAPPFKSANFTLSAQQCAAACGGPVDSCEGRVEYIGDPPTESVASITCVTSGPKSCHEDFDPFNLGSCPFGCGRMPAFVEATAEPDLRGAALLEALSVGAFAQLEDDAARHELPVDLRARITRAKHDERRHARLARALLREKGERLPKTPRVPRRARSLFAVARDNAVEGCVRESFGAFVAVLQARHANDASMRDFHRAIADDELAHAALSWDLHRALWPRLDARAQARVERARRRAIEGLLRQTPLARMFVEAMPW